MWPATCPSKFPAIVNPPFSLLAFPRPPSPPWIQRHVGHVGFLPVIDCLLLSQPQLFFLNERSDLPGFTRITGGFQSVRPK
jgi:hypothetical protein